MSKKVVLPLEKLKTRVEKQFKIKKLIGDIPIPVIFLNSTINCILHLFFKAFIIYDFFQSFL